MDIHRTTTELVEKLIYRLPVMIGYWDKELRSKFANLAYASFFGLDPDAIINRTMRDVVGEDLYKRNANKMKAALNGEEQTFFREAKFGEGEIKSLQFFYYPDIVKKEVLGFFVIIRDLSSLVKSEQENKYLQEQLIQNSKMIALGQIAGGIAHEINNPLSVISMNAKFAKDLINDYNLDRDKLLVFLTNIQTHSNRIDKIVSGLHFFSQEKSNDPFVDYSLEKIFEDTLSFCLAKIQTSEISYMQTHVSSEVMIRCNPVLISQVLLNLLNNSIDAVEELEDKWISISIEEHEKMVEIKIRDSGAGLSEDIVDKIMQPFFTSKATGKGTGLGLSISSGIVKQHGGELRVDTEAKNTTFILTLPK